MNEDEKQNILEKVEKGLAYSSLSKVRIAYHDFEDVLILPNGNLSKKEIQQKMLALFDNCTIAMQQNNAYVIKSILCPNMLKNIRFHKEYEVMIIEQGDVVASDKICNRCKRMVHNIVGECHNDTYSPNKQGEPNWSFRIASSEFEKYLFIKPGYVREQDFSEDLSFSKEHVAERIEEYKDRGKWRAQLNEIRNEFCRTCIKYHTKTCKKGYTGYTKPTKCMYEKEKLIERLREETKKDFGSMARAFWYFSQCGNEFQYMDGKTKRKSMRHIAVPGSKDGDMKPKGFYMSLVRYPYGLGDYGSRTHRYSWNKDGTKAKPKYDTYIPLSQYKKEFSTLVRNVKYKKKLHEELVCIAYLIYRYICATPGAQTGLGYGTSYLIYLGINTGWSEYGTSSSRPMVEVGVGASKYKTDRTYKELRDLFDSGNISIERK